MSVSELDFTPVQADGRGDFEVCGQTRMPVPPQARVTLWSRVPLADRPASDTRSRSTDNLSSAFFRGLFRSVLNLESEPLTFVPVNFTFCILHFAFLSCKTAPRQSFIIHR